MSPTADDLLKSAMTLPEIDRLELAAALIAASEPMKIEPAGDEWVAELERRSKSIDDGSAVLLSWDEVHRRAWRD